MILTQHWRPHFLQPADLYYFVIRNQETPAPASELTNPRFQPEDASQQQLSNSFLWSTYQPGSETFNWNSQHNWSSNKGPEHDDQTQEQIICRLALAPWDYILILDTDSKNFLKLQKSICIKWPRTGHWVSAANRCHGSVGRGMCVSSRISFRFIIKKQTCTACC